MSIYFLDSNIIMYILGSPHPLKTPCLRVLEKIRSSKIKVCTNTEVFQEILYRYYSIGKKDHGHIACELLKDIADPILSVTHEDIIKAISLLNNHPIPVRDAIHAATMLNHNIRHIISTDTHFDILPEIIRINPE
ncbi:MAG: type II toxin-antitoxin system VapC family toxin [Nitrospira sp.]|nr:type II toxin-antitoxin system VapC family toxin [Nitrospira sp.]